MVSRADALEIGFGCMTSVRPQGELRSSVAVKRFPFSDEWMARFRFARLNARRGIRRGRREAGGAEAPNEFAGPDKVSREQG